MNIFRAAQRIAASPDEGAFIRRLVSVFQAPNPDVVATLVIVLTAAVAIVDFATSSELVGAILFTLPLALCTSHPSRRFLWGVSGAVGVLTIAAEFWGFNRTWTHFSADGIINRGLLVASLFTLTAFIDKQNRSRKRSRQDTADIARQSASLSAQNKELEVLVEAAALDLNEHKLAERHLQNMEARYRGLLEAAPDAMVISNADGHILLVNAETVRMFGYAREELIGQAVEILVPPRFRAKHPGYRQDYIAHPRTRLMGEGVELFGLRKDNTEFPIEIGLGAIKSSEGALISSAIRDTTARRQAQEALRMSEERNRIAVEVTEMGSCVWKIDEDEITLSEQFQKMFGLTNVTQRYDDILQFIHADDRQALNDRVKNTLDTGLPYDIEYRIVRPGLPVRWVSARGRLDRNAEGGPRAIQGTILDITERKQAQEALRQRDAMQRTAADLMRSNEDLQQFAYVAAHDLQEPLRMVSSYTQLLAKRYKGRLDADADEFIAFAVDGANRMHLLIADLLAYCRVGTAGKELRATSAAAALEEALHNLKGALLESGGQVTHDVLPNVHADHVQLAQLFQNLVGNAIKYRGVEPPRIHVSTKLNDTQEWVFAIHDNGLGIEPQYFEKIFVMFQRLHAREEFSGTGIGLSLCKKIAERHGGRMWVESAVGKGSTFFLALPESTTQ